MFLATSTDGGKTFTVTASLEVPPITPSTYKDGFVSKRFGWMTVGNGLFLTDGKSISSALGMPALDDNSNVDFLNEQLGYLILDGHLYQTIDGGQLFIKMDSIEATK